MTVAESVGSDPGSECAEAHPASDARGTQPSHESQELSTQQRRSSVGGGMEDWRKGVLARLDVVLVSFDLLLSAIFIAYGYLSSSLYIRGVGVGLLIAGVTAGIAYLYRSRTAGP